jgi:isoquinoline 1-oxidoreductase beta subunit
VQEYVQDRLNLPTVVHVTLLGGGFGRKLEVDYGLEAAEVSKAFGGPVQVVWTREDDIQHDFYRPVTYHWMRAGWESDGTLKLWRHYLAAQGISGIAYHAGADVLNEDIAIRYRVEDQRTRSYVVNLPVHTGPWRGVLSATNAFANECFVDEVATALGQDPYEFRIGRLAENEPLRSTLELAAEKAGWGTPLPEGHGRGIACHKTYGQTSVAMVAEVSVIAGALRVEKVTCAIHCGQVVHPDMIAQQMEGSIAFGLTSLLKGEITYKDGRVQQSNLHDYPLLQMSEMPEVDVHIVQTGTTPTGLGEMGVPPIVPAAVNAIFYATGKRIRHTPIRAGDL